MEGLQLEALLVDIGTTLLQCQRIVQLCVERQHVQLHRLSVNLFYGVHHVLNELCVTGSCRVNPDNHLRLLRLLLVGTLCLHLLAIGVDGLDALFVNFLDGQSQQFEEPCGE